MSKRKKRNSREEKAKFNRLLIIIAVILLILIIALYFISLGKINIIGQEDEKTKRIRWIDERLKNLQVEAKSKEELKEKLDKKVRQYFFYTRMALSVFYFVANMAIFIWLTDNKKGCDDRLSTLLNYNEAALILILVALFIRFETPAEFRDVFKIIHLYIKGKIYRSHQELEVEIKNIYSEIEVLSKEKDGLANQEPPPDNTNKTG